MNLGYPIFIGMPKVSGAHQSKELFEMPNTVNWVIWNSVYNLVNTEVFTPILRVDRDYKNGRIY